jgi:hypothetical protein
MDSIIIKPKSKEELDFLTKLLEKLNINLQFVKGDKPNLATRKAIKDVEKGKSIKVKDSAELFTKLNI